MPFWCLVAALAWCWGCDRGLDAEATRQTGIAGRLHFVGEWPANVGQVAVAVYREPPASLADFFRINGWDTEVALGVESYDYFVPLDGEGVYQWIVVAWRQEDQFWDLTSLLGCYYLPDADFPSPVEVGPGEVVSDIDIEVNFAVLDHETELSTALCERALPAELLAELGR
ncbi:MAG: hypothetical protein F4Z57_19635 [Gemmatimonadetes bacterium]|nr:hypothetical protein [Gemmatimonadota bacterium]MYC70686.1 hypothetical protein [Gemmatimonadota bacterium]MYI61083.1 hypothetical protein [Gemmatimonadota bacterium]